MVRGPAAASHLLFALYPILIFAGLHFLDARLVAELTAWQWLALALPPALGIAVVVLDSEPLLRLYPASISASMLLLFGATLLRPPTMVERFARLRAPDLSEAGVRYTRRVTEAWCLFFVLNGALAVYTALFTSREIWALYNGIIAYVLMGTLFAGERVVRRRMMPAA